MSQNQQANPDSDTPIDAEANEQAQDNNQANADSAQADAQASAQDDDTQDTESSPENTLVDELNARIIALQLEVKTAKEIQARANAESYNAQKRMEQETEKAKKFVLQKFVKELLEVVDNLERAINSVQNDNDDAPVTALTEGVQLTHKSLLNVLNKHGVEIVDPLGEKFNPDYHEAVGIYPDAEPDHVGVVLQKGYTLNGRSIRPAMVQIGG